MLSYVVRISLDPTEGPETINKSKKKERQKERKETKRKEKILISRRKSESSGSSNTVTARRLSATKIASRFRRSANCLQKEGNIYLF